MASVQSQLASPPQSSADNESLAPEASQPGILIVDDDPVLLALLNTALRKSGFAVWLAGSGAEAIDIYQRQRTRINVVLLDVRMPGLDGPRTLAELQRLDPSVACCFMSGYTADYSLAELLSRGAMHFFDKPFRMNEVVRVLGCVAEQRGERRASGARPQPGPIGTAKDLIDHGGSTLHG
jgi:DNA-binding NtrC family response regulator